jgi:hypothetical protein
MFRLDYLSCFLTVVATILVGRKMWSGLVVSCANSLIVCVIGLHTSQYGFCGFRKFWHANSGNSGTIWIGRQGLFQVDVTGSSGWSIEVYEASAFQDSVQDGGGQILIV